jgi:hypothetical protein
MANYLTNDDVQNYGPDVVDFAQRASLHALAPELQRLEHQNSEMRQLLTRETKRGLHAELDRAIPNWRQLDLEPGWRDWLRGTHELSGVSRQQLLNDALERADAHRVITFFNGYLQTRHEQQPYRGSAAPSFTSGERPTYTRPQIAQLYEQHRKGAYRGREAEWARQEADIIAAAREGRILGAKDIAGR